MHELNQFDLVPPHSIPAEQALLGAMLVDSAFADAAAAVMHAEMFYLEDHRIIFDVVKKLRIANRPTDAIVLREELLKRSQLEIIGGTAYVGELLNAVPSAANGMHYAGVVRDKWQLRTLISVSNESLQHAYAQNEAPTDLINNAQAALSCVVAQDAASAVASLGDVINDEVESLERGEPPRLLATNFQPIDEVIGGLGPGETMLLGARPSMGKSTLERQIGVLLAQAENPVMYVSLEENDAKISRNVLAWLAQVDNHRIRRRDLSGEEIFHMRQVADAARNWPFHLVRHVFDVEKIYSLASAYKTRYGIKCLLIDYLQLVQAGGKDEFERSTKASLAIVKMARALGLPTICAAQLSRAVTNREGNRPTMTDLRQSGQIEQDADVILLLHREDYYRRKDPDYVPTNIAELLIEKNRDGERGDPIRLRSALKYQCFYPLPAESVVDLL